MIEKLIQFLNLSEDQKKQFEDLRASYVNEDKELNQKIKDLMNEKKSTFETKMEDLKNILTDEQKDRMKSLFDLFGPGRKGFGFGKSGFKGC